MASVASSYAQPVLPIQLPAAARGARAIEVLGDRLPEVAKAYGLKEQELVNLFRIQPSLGVDIEGALTFACDFRLSSADAENVKVTNSDALTSTSSTSQLAAGDSVDAFRLHSLPGASRVIYLDFDGQTTTGTSWNSAYASGAAIVSAPFDLDGDPSTFDATERAVIQGIWKRVAEDYAPFAIDVTTQDPGVEALRKTTSSDNSYGIRVVISPTNWYNTGAGGTAYIGSFNWNSDTPCWVFTAQLANSEKYIGEVVSHEVGHTVGLYHDGDPGGEYYAGQGNWAPIMGSGLYRPVTQFSKGEYASASNTQDDTAVVATYAPLVADDHGNALTSATVLSGPTVANGGTIETRSDVDVFRFETGEGAIAIKINSPANEPDLHLFAELLDSTGRVLQSNDISSLSASFSLNVSGGTYFLRVKGTGYGDPASTGYSNYGSLGNYLITGTLVGIAGKQAPVAKVTASTTSGTPGFTVAFSGQNSSDVDGTLVAYNWDFGNGSTATTMDASCTYNSSGSFIAVLTVTDNDGLTSSASVLVSVAAAANVAPTAVASTSSVSGSTVVFSSAGSLDSDGSIASYKWSFGDGTSSTAASPTKTYSAAGKYSAVLTVTDNAGASATASVSVSVASDTNRDVDIKQYSLGKSTANSGVSAISTVIVRDRMDRPVPGVTITIQWSGLVSGKSTGKTDANGQLLMTSGRSKKSGTITGTIVSVMPPAGVAYDALIYSALTVASIPVN